MQIYSVREQRLGHLAALFTVINWGTTFIATKILLEGFSPVEILVYRFLFGLIALTLACPRRLRVGNWRRELVFAGAGLTGVCLYYLLENLSLTMTTAANAGVVVSSAPLFTALLALIISRGKERVKANFYVGFLVAMAGICLISYDGAGFTVAVKGDLLAMGGAIAWAFYSMLTRKIASYGYSNVLTTRRIFAYGLIFMIPAACVLDFRWGFERLQQPEYIGMLLYLGIGACAVCFATWNYAVRILGAVPCSAYLYVTPVITVACSALILHEAVNAQSVVGAGLTLMGMALSEWDVLRELFRRKNT